ncbi:methyltransferase family protein [Streptomyces sp. 1114.5]|uniref:class I SAM-dependent methyltransferase n=1 Tax=unclassified Streptomyces TaxID=2593676 RepID=UPI000BD668B1|nr:MULTISPECIES: methyltransferase domain-containing protein [unclassified Streptomyces]RKT16598.1 methyltransferase family protein [Streptomyces sp. 1114.5]SOB82760.1 Methyltransferase domain-containing protein [Streptomyces sp. 1331.2]
MTADQHESRHQNGHHHGHGHAPSADFDWDALAAHLEHEADLRSDVVAEAAQWLTGLYGAGAWAGDGRGYSTVRRVLDVGSGPGVIAGLLADAFPTAEVVAVDQSAALLERARTRSNGRLGTQQADLPAEFDKLGEADLIWSGNAIHHLGDQQAALTSLAGLLRPGGLLAVAERGLPPRYLPRDFGLGRPGFQARLDAAHEDGFSTMRADLPGSVDEIEDWPAMLTRAGLVPSGTRTFLVDHPAPLDRPTRAYLHTQLSRLHDRLADVLTDEDRVTLEALLAEDAPTGILHRPDAFYLSAMTVHTARKP